MTKFSDLPEKTLLRPDEVARFFSVSVQTIYRWYDEGKLDGLKTPGHGLRFYRAVILETMLQSQAGQ